MSIEGNLNRIKEKLGKSTKLVAISKTKTLAQVMECYNAGQRIFGENKVQELVAKFEALPKDIEWHLVGHLQGNKVKFVAPFVSLIHSVDSLKLLQEINKQGEKCHRVISCLLQIYIAVEETKFGLDEEEAFSLLESEAFKQLKNIRIMGVMGMATNTDLTSAEREALQVKVEKLHRSWTKDRDYLAPPTVGKLAALDPAQVLTPPKGLEIGYVPIATRQELAK